MTDHKRPESIPGYEHPTTLTAASRDDVYKTFTEGKKKAKIGTTKLIKRYSCQLGVISEDLCPTCQGPIVTTCQCAFSDKKCAQGHIWYTDRSGSSKIGNPHKST